MITTRSSRCASSSSSLAVERMTSTCGPSHSSEVWRAYLSYFGFYTRSISGSLCAASSYSLLRMTCSVDKKEVEILFSFSAANLDPSFIGDNDEGLLGRCRCDGVVVGGGVRVFHLGGWYQHV